MAPSLETCNAILKEFTATQHYEEAQMATGTLTDVPNILTIPMDKIGKAKKQRDAMRNRYREEIQRFANEYNCSMFEAAHSVFDTILDTVDKYATPGIPNALAQTLLPYTTSMINDAGGVAPVQPQTYSPPSVTGKWYKSMLEAKKMPAKKPSDTLTKLDKFVTADDVTAEAYAVYTTWSDANKILKGVWAQTDSLYHYFLLQGYLGPNNTVSPGVIFGYKYVICRVLKTKPYISENWYSSYQVSVPTKGFKWRKLKNKAIYKLQDYSKTPKGTSSKYVSPTAQYIYSTHLHTGASYALIVNKPGETPYTYAGSFASKYKLPTGYKWVQDAMSLHYYVAAI